MRSLLQNKSKHEADLGIMLKKIRNHFVDRMRREMRQAVKGRKSSVANDNTQAAFEL